MVHRISKRDGEPDTKNRRKPSKEKQNATHTHKTGSIVRVILENNKIQLVVYSDGRR